MDKDIRFTDKKVDDSWKEQTAREKGVQQPRDQKKESSPQPTSALSAETSAIFFNFITSLGYQAMMHLGEIPNPSSRKNEVNLDAAKEIIDLLSEFKKKTHGNTGEQERDFFENVLAELQLRYAQKV